jgi:hypothetical protein
MIGPLYNGGVTVVTKLLILSWAMDEFIGVVLDVLQSHAVALIQFPQPETVSKAMRDMKHLCTCRWKPEHAQTIMESIDGLLESLDEMGYPLSSPLAPIQAVSPSDTIEIGDSAFYAAFEAIVRDDVAALCYLFDEHPLTLDAPVEVVPQAYPWLQRGDTPVVVAERFGCVWSLRFLQWQRGRESSATVRTPLMMGKPLLAGKKPENKRLSGVAPPRRRGSYSVRRFEC